MPAPGRKCRRRLGSKLEVVQVFPFRTAQPLPGHGGVSSSTTTGPFTAAESDPDVDETVLLDQLRAHANWYVTEVRGYSP